MYRKLLIVPLAATLAVPLLAVTVQAASASSRYAGKAPRPQAAAGHQSSSAKNPAQPFAGFKGYQVVTSGTFVDTAGTQSNGVAVCPANKQLVGGGAVIAGSSLAENLNGSVPSDALSWRAYVNNSSGTNGTFTVYAVCVKKIQNYSIQVSSGVANPPGAQSTATAACPSGTVSLGGGGDGSSSSTAVNLNTSIPVNKGWRVDVNNNSAGSDTAFAAVICGKKPTGYARVSGDTTLMDSSTQGNAVVTCPSGTLAYSGGGYSSSNSLVVDLNSSVPFSTTGWRAFENNGSADSNGITAYAVCGKAS